MTSCLLPPFVRFHWTLSKFKAKQLKDKYTPKCSIPTLYWHILKNQNGWFEGNWQWLAVSHRHSTRSTYQHAIHGEGATLYLTKLEIGVFVLKFYLATRYWSTVVQFDRCQVERFMMENLREV